MSEKTKRARRIAELIQSVISQTLRKEVSDPRLQKASITGIDLAPDYGNAVLFFTLFNEQDDEAIKAAEKAFKKASGFFRHAISRSTELRYTPQLSFEYDTATLNAEHISRLIDEVAPEDDEPTEA